MVGNLNTLSKGINLYICKSFRSYLFEIAVSYCNNRLPNYFLIKFVLPCCTQGHLENCSKPHESQQSDSSWTGSMDGYQ